MSDDIAVTVIDADAVINAVDSNTDITVQDSVDTEENTVADETPITITVDGDINITISNDTLKEGYIRETFTGNTGTNVLLVLGNIFRTNSFTAYLNGILMEKDTDYTEGVSRDRFTVLVDLVTTDKIEVRYVVN
jgi:hypothetical protein